MERWPKGSRPPRHRRAWLTDQRGRNYRLGPTVAFQIYYQPTEGRLWARMFRDGQPLRVPSLVSRDEFVAEVGNVSGAYQLQPIDAAGRQCGDPPSIVFLGTAPPPATPPVVRPIAADDGDDASDVHTDAAT